MGKKSSKNKIVNAKKHAPAKNNNENIIIIAVAAVFVIAIAVIIVLAMREPDKKKTNTTLTNKELNADNEPTVEPTTDESKFYKEMPEITENPIVTMEIEGYGTIEMELYPKIAPNTVCNMISLVKKGFYDNNTIHRVLKGFVVQGGDPDGNGRGGPGYSIRGEFTNNGFVNDLKHDYGVLSMARATPADSAGSQFFICLSADRTAHLNGNYATFGKVIKGMEIVDKIAATEKVIDDNGTLAKNLKIVKATVDTKGVDYPEPDKIDK